MRRPRTRLGIRPTRSEQPGLPSAALNYLENSINLNLFERSWRSEPSTKSSTQDFVTQYCLLTGPAGGVESRNTKLPLKSGCVAFVTRISSTRAQSSDLLTWLSGR